MNGNVKKTIVGASCMACVLLAYAEEALVADGPWKMEQATKCGVCAAGRSDETAFWQARIDATAARGVGQVTVPAGRHLVAGLFLRDNIELHLEEGAVLEGLVGLEHYPVLSMPHSEGTWSAIVMATDGTNLYCCCYSKQSNTAVLTPDLKLLGTCRFRGSEGFCRVPESVVGKSKGSCFAVVHACGGNMRGWRADPKGNPPQIELKLVPLSAVLKPSKSKWG